MLYPEQWEWGKVAILQTDGGVAWDIVKAVLAKSSGVVALDAYIGNTDRDNHRNAIFGMDKRHPAEDTFMFLDHANSLNYGNRWKNIGWDTVEFPPIYAPMSNALDLSLVAVMIARIEALPDNELERIVLRIPDDFMNAEHRQVVLAGLLGRRALVRDTLHKRLGGLEA
jgi:hypothetical protein